MRFISRICFHGGVGEAGRKRGAVEADTGADLLGDGDAAAGLEPLPAEKIGQRTRGGAVAAVAEHTAPFQGRHRGDRELVQTARHAFAEQENGE